MHTAHAVSAGLGNDEEVKSKVFKQKLIIKHWLKNISLKHIQYHNFMGKGWERFNWKRVEQGEMKGKIKKVLGNG